MKQYEAKMFKHLVRFFEHVKFDMHTTNWRSREKDINFIVGNFPHLNHLSLNLSMANGERPALLEQLKKVIRKNPTIQSIELLIECPPSLLKFISQELPALEHLKVHYSPISFG